MGIVTEADMNAIATRIKAISEDDWQRRATADAIAAARQIVGGDGINTRAAISSLSDIEWGSIAAAAIFAWIKTKAEQAVAEGLGYDEAIRAMTTRDPAPWEAGAVEAILPALGDLQGIDWSKPVGAWSKPEIVSFAWQIYRLTNGAIAARDEGAVCTITRKLNSYEMQREASASQGGPLLCPAELEDEIPF